MSFTQISLCSFIISLSTLNMNVLAMDTLEQSIEKELHTLDLSIINIAKNLQHVRKQKEKDEKIFIDCMRQRAIEHNNNLRESMTTDCSAAIKAYKGEIIYSCPFTPDSFVYSNTGSEDKYNTMKNLLFSKNLSYIVHKENFKRGKRLNDIEFLQNIELELQRENSDNKK